MKNNDQDYQSLKHDLDQVLAELQAESTDIDAALKGYERGLELTKRLEDYLKNAENKIIQLKTKAD